MKKTLLLSIVFWSLTSFSYSQKITINLNTVSLNKVLKEIRKKANVNFFYSDKELNVDKIVTANYNDIEVIEIVNDLISPNFTAFKTSEGIILITPIKQSQKTIIVTGTVKDEEGELLPSVQILIKGKRRGVTTDLEGKYTIEALENDVLIFSYLGYKKQEIPINGKKVINVVLKEDIAKIEEVVVTGIVQRKKESFTGAVKIATGEELKTIGNLNVVESLKTLDPSFVVLENNQFGSNPNVLPNIEVRGTSSLDTDGLRDEFGASPNQPLFVLDGFETTLRTIVDLDMNRVKSITILKDAASTALYGAKAANGVVVVETKTPRYGKLRVDYTSDFRVEAPDLSVYNLMNAEEKLRFEVLSGRWTHYDTGHPESQYKLDQQYNGILAEVRRGVNTYWLSQPLQTGTSLAHSLFVSGGDEHFQYGVGVNYRNQNGVMIGSDREIWGSNIRLSYRKNKLNITNNLYINGSDANESKYGSFSSYARANPYYRKTNDEGIITKYLDEDPQVNGRFDSPNVPNPLYNSTLNSINNTTSFDIRNNLGAIWTFSKQLRFTTNLQLTKGISTGIKFTPPEHTNFTNIDIFEKGVYNNIRTDNFSYRINSMLTYADVFNEKHRLTTNIRAEAEETKNTRLGLTAVGFPYGSNGNPIFSYSYAPDSKPSAASRLYRRVNVLASANYSYNNTYSIDATYRLDGSTVFGKNEKFSPFWVVGLGWNIHKTANLDPDMVQMFKLRGNIGTTGNQGFGSLTSTAVYGFSSDVNIYGQGVELITIENPDLKWQKTLDMSFGLDLTLLGNRLNASFNYYDKTTDPLVVLIDLPSSTGLKKYPINIGILKTKGVETVINYSPIYKPNQNIVWTIGYTANLIKSTYDKFGNQLESLNEKAKENNSLLRYKDGYSPQDLWAVPSLGIDPSTGREVFLTKDGKQTFEYDQNNEEIMGNSRPDIQGVISSNLRYKNFSLGINLRYRLGGDVFNSALFGKVENLDIIDILYNQDRRALYDRWQKPGDVAQFKSISITSSTPISSRFIQEENTITGESINIGYQFKQAKWIKKIGISTLRFTAYMNDVFRLSTVKAERGIEYPFARSFSCSLNASF